MSTAQLLERMEILAQHIQNVADEAYELGLTTLGNSLIDQGNALYVEMGIVEAEQ